MTYECGTYASYKLDGCRCYPCGLVRSEYEMNRQRAIAYGTWQPFVDATPVRTHVEHLRLCGIGLRRLAELSGVQRSVLVKLMKGSAGRAPSRRVRPHTATALLAVEPTLDNLAGHTPVDATGARRRVQALTVMGWSWGQLANRLDVRLANFHTQVKSARVSAKFARQVRDLYEQLWDVPPPQTTPAERQAAARSRNRAKAAGWLPPADWDDDLIDVPDAHLDDAIARKIAEMPDSMLRSSRNAYNQGDRSMLVRAAALEWQRQRKTRQLTAPPDLVGAGA